MYKKTMILIEAIKLPCWLRIKRSKYRKRLRDFLRKKRDIFDLNQLFVLYLHSKRNTN